MCWERSPNLYGFPVIFSGIKSWRKRQKAMKMNDPNQTNAYSKMSKTVHRYITSKQSKWREHHFSGCRCSIRTGPSHCGDHKQPPKQLTLLTRPPIKDFVMSPNLYPRLSLLLLSPLLSSLFFLLVCKIRFFPAKAVPTSVFDKNNDGDSCSNDCVRPV